MLERGAKLGSVRPEEVQFLAQMLDDLPALAWGEAPQRDREPPAPPEKGQPQPFAALVVGGEDGRGALGRGPRARRELRVRAHGGRAGGARSRAGLRAGRRHHRRRRARGARAHRGAARRSADRAGAHRRRGRLPARRTPRASSRSAWPRCSPSPSRPRPCGERATRSSTRARAGRVRADDPGRAHARAARDRLAEELKRALVDSVDRPARRVPRPARRGHRGARRAVGRHRARAARW